jgi:ABC-type transport system involved in cytochrome c biogenesis permease subunit
VIDLFAALLTIAWYLRATVEYIGLVYGWRWARRGRALTHLALALVVHLAALVGLSLRAGRLPTATALETLPLAGWLVVAFCLVVDARWRAPAMGVFAAPVGIASVLALVWARPSGAVPAGELADPWLQIHIILILIGYAALALAFGSALIYLAQDRALRAKQPSALSRHLPSVQAADDTAYRLVAIGFPLLTAGLAIGVLMLQQMRGVYWLWNDVKLNLSGVTWIVFAVYLHARMVRGWKGRRTAVLLVIGFACVIATYLGVSFLVPGSWHNAPFGSTARG